MRKGSSNNAFAILSIYACCFLMGLSITLCAQDDDRADLASTERLSKKSPDSAFLVLKEMYGKALEKKDRVATGTCLQQMGQICYYLGSYPKALDFHLQADKIFREAGKLDLVAGNLNDMGILYYYNKQRETARRQYDEALAIYAQTHNREGLAVTYGKIGHLYEKQQRDDSAFYFQRLALQQFSISSHKQGVAKIYENMGSIFEDIANYDSARYYFVNSLALYEQTGETVASIEVVNNLGDIYRKTGHYQQALEETRKALALAVRTDDLYEKGAAYKDLGKTFNLLNENDSAFHYLELSRKASIEIYSQENYRQTAFLSVLFDIDKKNDEIVALENEKRVNVIIAISAAVVIGLLAVLGWVAVSRQRLKIQNEKTVNEKERNIYKTQHELMTLELKNIQLQEEKLTSELEVKKKELTSYTLHIIEKNQLLEKIQERLDTMVKDDKRDQKKQLQQLTQQIAQNFNNDRYWTEFREIFEQVHQQFFDGLKLKSDDLTGNDLRLAALIKLNFESKDIATFLGISLDSLRVARYRLRKKLNLDRNESFTSFLQSL